ncbi:MAG: DNA recombination protein RmuC [bacterium]|nr:DNA recombination protein RmuC [bacterium]
MSQTEILLVAILGLNLLLTLILFVRGRKSGDEDSSGALSENFLALKSEILTRQMEGMNSLRDSLDRANRVLDERLSEGNLNLDRRLEMIGEIENRLGQLQQQTIQIESIGSNIQSLSELLKPPKVRGGLGEMLLEHILAQVLPIKLYERQYRFSNGKTVDAVIRVGEMILPVDSKFPLESYQRVLASGEEEKAAQTEFKRTMKKHIDDISEKYIQPEEGTTQFALMYIPAEAIYARFVSDPDYDGLSYALSKQVIPTSPGHLYGFLVSVIELYRQTSLFSTGRKELSAALSKLAESVVNLKSYHSRMEGSLRSAVGSLDKSKKEVDSMESGLVRLREPNADSYSEDVSHKEA